MPRGEDLRRNDFRTSWQGQKKRPPFLEAFGIIWYKLRAV